MCDGWNPLVCRWFNHQIRAPVVFKLLHILQSSCLKSRVSLLVPLFCRNEQSPTLGLGRVRTDSVEDKGLNQQASRQASKYSIDRSINQHPRRVTPCNIWWGCSVLGPLFQQPGPGARFSKDPVTYRARQVSLVINVS